MKQVFQEVLFHTVHTIIQFKKKIIAYNFQKGKNVL